jgi:uncharacterized membrane protein
MSGAQATPMNTARPVLLDTVLFPHRSLSQLGFWVLIGGVAAICLVVGGAFYLAGAWPVVGFLGLDVVVLYWAFKINYSRARLSERLLLSENCLLVRRIDPNRREQTWRFQPNWLRVVMPDPERSESQLVLVSHGRRLAIGTFLSPVERAEVANALRAALAKLQNVYYR